MKPARRLPYEEKIVVQAAARDERVLVGADEGIELGSEAQRQNLREDLGDEVN